ncbi:C1 family peptidase [Lewinella sp. W8]|uniref:C1 family peptidase n=1 Tax=Lewinella sp. W8 TaxID=2528208 RepID=UPI0010681FDE|nr:C1 family peptidase [Lewinella sp. W8]MTB52823.1 DUF4384 domain-containing protein [Lewinella sp. W8]
MSVVFPRCRAICPVSLMTLLCLFLSYTTLEAQRYPTGEVFDAEVYNALPLKAKVSTRSILPPRVSLEQYTPTPGDQGAFMTCSAWSSAYHFRTIIEAKQRGITDRTQIDKLTFSPTWVYEILKSEDDNSCGGGLMTAKTLLVFKELGVPSYSSLPFTCLAGSQQERFSQLDPLMEEAARARIRDLQILFLAKEGVDPQEKIQAIKKVLAEGYPVLISHTLYDSFHSAEEVWYTQAGEDQASDRHGSHAMVIVGFDDDKYGGAFRYMNSWGSNWGDNGFIWVPYATTGKLCYGAYQAFPFAPQAPPAPAPVPAPAPAPAPTPAPAPAPPPPPPVAASLPAGSLDFVLRSGEAMPVSRVSTRNLIVEDDVVPVSTYRMQTAYPSGTRFRFYLNTETEGYVYALATDLSGKINQIFPYAPGVSPLVGSSSVIAFPADDKVIRMDNQAGTDYLLVLFSQQALDLPAIKRDMDALSGGLTERLGKVLGKALVDPGQVQYEAGRAGFRVRTGATGTVVPLMVAIEHL